MSKRFERELEWENKLIVSLLTGEPLNDKEMREYNEFIEKSNKESMIGTVILSILTIIAIIEYI